MPATAPTTTTARSACSDRLLTRYSGVMTVAMNGIPAVFVVNVA